MNTIADRLRAFGDANFASIKAFALAMEMSPPALQNYLRGKSEPGTPVLLRLINLGCDINWLLTGEIEGAGPCSDQEKIKELEEEVESLRNRITAISELSNTVREIKQKQIRGKREG